MEVLVHSSIYICLLRIKLIGSSWHHLKMSRLSNGTTHSSLFREFFKWNQIIGDLLFNPTRPYQIAFVKIGPFSHLKPPPILQNRSHKREVVAASDEEFEVSGLERRVSW